MKKKYLFLLFLVLAIVLSYSLALVACDNNSTNGNNTTQGGDNGDGDYYGGHYY